MTKRLEDFRWQRETAGPGEVHSLFYHGECAGILQRVSAYWTDTPEWQFFQTSAAPAVTLGTVNELSVDEAKNMAIGIAITGVDLRR